MAIEGFEPYTDMTSDVLANCAEIAKRLKAYTSDRPWHGADIARTFGFVTSSGHPRTDKVRKAVAFLRCHHRMPIGSSGDGYFWATSADELTGTIEHLTARRNALNVVLTALNLTRKNLEQGQASLFGDSEIIREFR